MFKKGFKFYCGMCAASLAISAAIAAVVIWWEAVRDFFCEGFNRISNLFVHQYDGDEEE